MANIVKPFGYRYEDDYDVSNYTIHYNLSPSKANTSTKEVALALAKDKLDKCRREKRETHTTSPANFAQLNLASDLYVDFVKLFCSKNRKGDPYYHQFIDKLLKLALKDPSSKCGEQVSRIIFKEDLLDRLSEIDKQQYQDTEFRRYQIFKTLFDKQREVLLDDNIRDKCIICSRRAGKTELAARTLIYTALIPNSPIFYINLTFDNAMKQMFGLLIELSDELDLKRIKEDKSEGVIIFENGSSITLRGNANKYEIEKLRGFKARLVIIDEAQSQRNLKSLIDDVVEPLLFDYKDSKLIIQGTPPRQPNTYLESLYNRYIVPTNRAKSYNWNMSNNPYIPDFETELEELCKKKGLTKDSPLIKREYLGSIGTYDTEAQIFKGYKVFETKTNYVEDQTIYLNYISYISKSFIPTHIAIGLDFGFSDYNSIAALAYNVNTKKGYVIYEAKFNRATVSQIVGHINDCYNECRNFYIDRCPVNKYNIKLTETNEDNNYSLDNIHLYGDTSDESIIYELNQTYNLPAFKAYKYNKEMAISQLADKTSTGVILIGQNGILEDEFQRILLARDKETDALLSKIDDSIFHPEITMALLYASREYFNNIGEDKIEYKKEL